MRNISAARQRSKGSIMLLELILCIMIFSLCAAASISIFAQSHGEAKNARALSAACIKAQSAAEAFKAAKGRVYEAARLMDGVCPGNFHFNVFFNDEWEQCEENSAKKLTLTISDAQAETGLINAQIIVTDGESTVYKLSTAYVPLETGGVK